MSSVLTTRMLCCLPPYNAGLSLRKLTAGFRRQYQAAAVSSSHFLSRNNRKVPLQTLELYALSLQGQSGL
jgi:hypothetical protein